MLQSNKNVYCIKQFKNIITIYIIIHKHSQSVTVSCNMQFNRFKSK